MEAHCDFSVVSLISHLRLQRMFQMENKLTPDSTGTVMVPAVVSNDTTALVQSNVRVRYIAYRFRWSVDTLIKRVEKALPSRIEQGMYLKVAIGYRIQPESLRTMLRVFRGDQDLGPVDLQSFRTGPNMYKSRFDDIAERIEQTMLLIDKTADSAEYMMSMEHAARLVEAYGAHAEEVLGQIVENIFDVAQYLGIKSESPKRIVGVAIKVLVEEVITREQGSPIPLTIEDMFAHRVKRSR